MKDYCIVSMGVSGWYPMGIQRLRKSLEAVKFQGDFLYWTAGYPDDCPTHEQVPYGFKPWAMNYARKLGYKQVMWLDASFWAINYVDDNFDTIKETGSLIIKSGNLIGQWTSDKALAGFGVSRDEAMKMMMMVAGGFGLSFDNEKSNAFLDMWLEKSKDGFSFQGKWHNKDLSMSQDTRCRGHRHDMSIASLIFHKLGMSFAEDHHFFSYYEAYKNTAPQKINLKTSFLLQGM